MSPRSVESIVTQVKNFYSVYYSQIADTMVVYDLDIRIIDSAKEILENTSFNKDGINCSVFKEIDEKNKSRYGLKINFYPRSY